MSAIKFCHPDREMRDQCFSVQPLGQKDWKILILEDAW